MGVLTKKPKTFEVQFSDPNKSAYCGGDKVAGRVIVEVAEVVQISAVKLFGIGCAKVDYNKGKLHCREEIEYLKYEELLHLDHQPTGEIDCTHKLLLTGCANLEGSTFPVSRPNFCVLWRALQSYLNYFKDILIRIHNVIYSDIFLKSVIK